MEDEEDFRPIVELNLSRRTHTALKKAGVHTVHDVQQGLEKIREIQGIGDVGLREVERGLRNLPQP